MPGLVLKQELMQELHVKTSLTAYETLQYLSVSDIYSDQTRAPSSLLSVIKIKINLSSELLPLWNIKSFWNQCEIFVKLSFRIATGYGEDSSVV